MPVPELTFEMMVVLGMLGLTIVLFVTELLRVDVTAILIMVLLGLLSNVPGLEGLADVEQHHRHGPDLVGDAQLSYGLEVLAVLIVGEALGEVLARSILGTALGGGRAGPARQKQHH